MENENVVCCFCGESLKYINAIEIGISLTTDREEVQGLYSHTKCFKKVLHPSIPTLIDGDEDEKS